MWGPALDRRVGNSGGWRARRFANRRGDGGWMPARHIFKQPLFRNFKNCLDAPLVVAPHTSALVELGPIFKAESLCSTTDSEHNGCFTPIRTTRTTRKSSRKKNIARIRNDRREWPLDLSILYSAKDDCQQDDMQNVDNITSTTLQASGMWANSVPRWRILMMYYYAVFLFAAHQQLDQSVFLLVVVSSIICALAIRRTVVALYCKLPVDYGSYDFRNFARNGIFTKPVRINRICSVIAFQAHLLGGKTWYHPAYGVRTFVLFWLLGHMRHVSNSARQYLCLAFALFRFGCILYGSDLRELELI